MPYFDGCPDDAAKYHDDYVAFWENAVKMIYSGLKIVSEVGKPGNPVILVEDVKCIKLPIEINDKNDQTGGKRQAFTEAFDPVKKYFIGYMTKNGSVPTLEEVLSNVKPHPVYGMR